MLINSSDGDEFRLAKRKKAAPDTQRVSESDFGPGILAYQAIIHDLNRENVELKQRIAILESGEKQTIYPWKAE